MQKKILIITVILFLFSCGRKTIGTTNGKITSWSGAEIEKHLKKNHSKSTNAYNLKQLGDSNNLPIEKIGDFISYKWKPNYKDQNANNPYYLEIKNSNRVILLGWGYGMWDEIYSIVEMDTQSSIILSVSFKAKEDKVEFENMISDENFTKQFSGLKILSTESSFTDAKNSINYKFDETEIDGITGATVTVDGAIHLLNEMINTYSRVIK